MSFNSHCNWRCNSSGGGGKRMYGSALSTDYSLTYTREERQSDGSVSLWVVEDGAEKVTEDESKLK